MLRASMALLSLRNVTRRFGGIVALDGVSFDVGEGQIVGLIGPNGAGKTTAFNVITRLYTPNEGEVEFAGENLLKSSVHGIVRRGIARTLNVELFKTMTVLDNVLVGAHTRAQGRGEAHEAIDYVGLGGVAARPVAGLPFGTLKRVELARALVSQPAPPPRRARGRAQPRGGRGARALHPADPRRPQAHGAPRRAPHEPGHGDLGPRQRDELRPHDRGRHTRQGRANPAVIEAYLGTDEAPQPERNPRTRSRMALLELRDVAARYEPVRALEGVSLAVEEGQIVAVLGANGAGRRRRSAPSPARCGAWARSPSTGKALGRRGPEAVAHLGVAHVPEAATPSPSSPSRTCASAPTRGAARLEGDVRRMTEYFPGWRIGSGSARAPSRAASSKCSPSPAR